jgi:acyl carrier protein
MEEIFDLAVSILAKQLDIEPEDITMETTFEHLDADSIYLVEMIMALEDNYDVEFPEEDMENYTTVGSLISALYKYLKQVKNE